MDGSVFWHLGQAAILGLVQGVTEFLPVSSSGHLIIARDFLRLADPGNFFDAVLHLATLSAILIYFRRDWWQMLIGSKSKKGDQRALLVDRRTLWLILLATIPGLVAGFWGHQWVEQNFRSVSTVAILMMAVGIIYLIFERRVKHPKTSKNLTGWDAISIGLAQAVAIVPGISRSGATMLAGRYAGLTREMAARFSFLLAAPIITAAGGYSLYQAIASKLISQDYWFWIVAFGFSLASGMLVISWLLKFFQKYSLNSFGYYLIIAGAGLLIYGLVK